MNIAKQIAIVFSISMMILSCTNSTKPTENQSQDTLVENQNTIAEKSNTDFTGNYVSEDYAKRNEGYDWIAVKVTNAGADQLNISVRSRADKKKPTCTVDAFASKRNDSTYLAEVNGKNVLFIFTKDQVTIKAENEADQGVLSFVCSGGATAAGTYTKISEPLDSAQIDKTLYSNVLILQDVGFNVSSVEEQENNVLKIFTFGLPNEFKESINIGNQTIQNVEVADLNADGSPELFIYTKNKDNKANLYAYSVNNKKSMSVISFTPTAENKEINNGYNGNDEFRVVENSLVQRFPIVLNGKETGKIRQVEYKLVDGEASRKLIVKKQTEYDK